MNNYIIEPYTTPEVSIPRLLIQPKELPKIEFNPFKTQTTDNNEISSFFKYTEDKPSSLFGALIHSSYNPLLESHQLLENRFEIPSLEDAPDLLDRLLLNEENTSSTTMITTTTTQQQQLSNNNTDIVKVQNNEESIDSNNSFLSTSDDENISQTYIPVPGLSSSEGTDNTIITTFNNNNEIISNKNKEIISNKRKIIKKKKKVLRWDNNETTTKQFTMQKQAMYDLLKRYDYYIKKKIIYLSEETLCRYSRMVVQGIPSSLYIYNEETRKFNLCDDEIALSNASIPSLRNLLFTFCIIGTHYKRILEIAEYYSKDICHCGQICGSFGRTLLLILNEYDNEILDLFNGNDINKAYFDCRTIYFKLQLLAEICYCGVSSNGENCIEYENLLLTTEIPLDILSCPSILLIPRGIELINYLTNWCNNCIKQSNSIYSNICYFLLFQTLEPYLLYLWTWCHYGYLTVTYININILIYL